MSWMMVGSAAVSVIGGMLSGGGGGVDNRSIIANANQSRDYNINLTKQYLHGVVRNNYSAGLRNVQFGLQKRKLAQEGYNLSVQEQAVQGETEASLAATGTVGSSANAARADVAMKAGEAKAALGQTFEHVVTDYNTDIDMLGMNAKTEALAATTNTFTKYKAESGNDTGSLIGSLLQAGAGVMMNRSLRNMQLGLGSSGGATTGTNAITMNGLRL